MRMVANGSKGEKRTREKMDGQGGGDIRGRGTVVGASVRPSKGGGDIRGRGTVVGGSVRPSKSGTKVIGKKAKRICPLTEYHGHFVIHVKKGHYLIDERN